MAQRPATKGRRLFRLAGMTARVATRYTTSRVKSVFQNEEDAQRDRAKAHAEAGQLIAQTLGELKGAVMKVGQMASIAGDLLPKELSSALGALQREAPPMDFEVIAEQIERELGAPPPMLFDHFEQEPFASASIGQVHRARTDDGREVVVKVQYPGVDDAVDSDLAHLKIALRASGLVKIKRKALDAVFGELRARLHEELDYCNEADNVRLFGEMYDDDDAVVVPQVVGERSSQRVLTLTYEPGHHISELEDFGQPVLDEIGASLFRVIADQIFKHQVLHADPNPGNFAFRPDGTVVLYDFGCVKRLDPEIIQAYRDTIRAGFDEDYEGIEQGLVRLGARNTDGPSVPLSYYKPWRDIFMRPLLSDGPYDFGASQLQNEAIKLVPGSLKYLSSFQPPAELVFLDRVVVGHYGNLRTLGARGQYRPLLEAYLGS
ncbi:MAG: AarF/ABC1/UbiB kinase family protein [Deltaproteobacteria bacterium]|nr:AarF/ABC1/UbiB kinase family protein [Deltaproteobacteria bacterium]